METKICSGKYGCGKELSINEFGTYKKKYKNNTYMLLWSYCKKCENERSKAFHKTDAGKKAVRKYQQSEKGKLAEKRTRTSIKGRLRKKKHDRTYYLKNIPKFREASKNGKNVLKDWYVKDILKTTMSIINPTSEFIEAKRNQLTLYRYVKKLRTITANESDIN